MDAGHHDPSLSHFRDGHDAALWSVQPDQLARGRQPRDALAKTISYKVASLQELESCVREYVNNPPEQPEHAEAQLSFFIGTVFLIPDPTSSAFKPRPTHEFTQQPVQDGLDSPYGCSSHSCQPVSDPATTHSLSTLSSAADMGPKAEQQISVSIPEALMPTSDPQTKMRKQRAIAKCCVDAIQRVDGYRYSFHNCWNSREDDSFRFSYYCNDSLLNKDRAANCKSGKLGRRAAKPVYDCRGIISIKFSSTKKSLDVIYKHVPLHGTYEERAPPPRKQSKRRKFLEIHDPDALERIANRSNRAKEDTEITSPSKKMRKSMSDAHSLSNSSIESDLRTHSLHSLLELIWVDPSSPPPQCVVTSDQAAPQEQIAWQLAKQSTRPRTSCDVCRARKTRCDGTRPACCTCVEKKRRCVYGEPVGEKRQGRCNEASETGQRLQPVHSEMTELDRMKRELEDARARIQELELEKQRSVQRLQMVSLPPFPPQPQAHAQESCSRQHQPPVPDQCHQQQQQQQQIGRTSQHGMEDGQQVGYQLDNQAMQAMQAAPRNYFAARNPNSYSSLSEISTSNGRLSQGNGSPCRRPLQTRQSIHGNEAGVAAVAASVDAVHSYERGEYSWPPPTGFYGYANADQQQAVRQQQHGPSPQVPLAQRESRWSTEVGSSGKLSLSDYP